MAKSIKITNIARYPVECVATIPMTDCGTYRLCTAELGARQWEVRDYGDRIVVSGVMGRVMRRCGLRDRIIAAVFGMPERSLAGTKIFKTWVSQRSIRFE